MQTDVRFRPSFATVFVTLMPGESLVAEADAMASMSTHIDMTTRWNGGFFKAILRRLFGGETLFVNEFSCPKSQSSVDLVLTQPTPGDIQSLELKGNVMYLQRGAYIASTPGVTLGLGWAGLASWFGGEGLFRLRVSGTGTVWFGGYGGVFEKTVNGEYVVDTGHLLAYEPTLSMSVGLSGGIFSSFFGGEGFVSRIRGQGKIYMQSRSLDGLAAWTNGHLY